MAGGGGDGADGGGVGLAGEDQTESVEERKNKLIREDGTKYSFAF